MAPKLTQELTQELYPKQRQARDVLIIRHAQSTGNMLKSYSTHPVNPHYFPVHLTLTGQAQAKNLASRLEEEGYSAGNIAVMLVSPLPRTQETALILAEQMGISPKRIVIDDQLLERNLGLKDGMPYEALGEGDHWYPDNPEGFQGELSVQVRQRMLEVWERAVNWQEPGHVLVVSHGQPIHSLSVAVCEHPCRLNNASYIKVSVPPGVQATQPGSWPLPCEATSCR